MLDRQYRVSFKLSTLLIILLMLPLNIDGYDLTDDAGITLLRMGNMGLLTYLCFDMDCISVVVAVTLIKKRSGLSHSLWLT